MSLNKTTSCIGRYCGFQPDPGLPGQWDLNKCGACPWGYRTNDTKYCTRCEDSPTEFDWLYLGFMALLPCMLHWTYISKNKTQVKALVAQLVSSFVECISAGLLALISMEPQGSLKLVSCGVMRLSDWYTMFYNPQIQYTETIHCTQEAVYPLMTVVCVYYAYTLLLMLILRPLVLPWIAPSKQWRDPIYAALYFHPILVVTQAFAGGLLYYAFPYVTVIASVVALAAYLVWAEMTNLNALKRHLVRNILIIFWHFALLAFGIVAISMPYFPYLALVPGPLVFYFLTVQFTKPDNIGKEWHHEGS